MKCKVAVSVCSQPRPAITITAVPIALIPYCNVGEGTRTHQPERGEQYGRLLPPLREKVSNVLHADAIIVTFTTPMSRHIPCVSYGNHITRS